MSQQCETESVQPTWVTVGFSICSFIMLVITVIYSMKDLKKPPSSQTKPHQIKPHESVPSQHTNTVKTAQETEEKAERSGAAILAETVSITTAGDIKGDKEDNRDNASYQAVDVMEKEEKYGGSSTAPISTSHKYTEISTKGQDEEEQDDKIKTDRDKGGNVAISIQSKLDKIATDKAATGPEIDDINNADNTANKGESEWDKAAGCFGKFKLCAKDVWGRKAVYLPLISHLSDTATDFAAVLEFGIVAANYNANQCGVNVWYLFVLSICCMVLYRVMSSWKVYEITGSYSRACFQWLDMELFRVLYISHLYGLTGKSSPQRLLSVLEAVFEAAPQSVIQMVFLMFTRNKSPVIIASAIFSFLNLTFTVIGDDAKMLGIEAAKPSCISIKYGEKKFIKFVLLHLYRFMDIPSKVLSFIFLWYFISGFVCVVFVLIDIGISLYLYWKTRNTDALLSVVAIPFSFGNSEHRLWLFGYWCWGIISSLIVNVLIWTLAMMERNIFDLEPAFIIALWMYCSLCLFAKWFIAYLLIWLIDLDTNASKERADLDALISNGKFDDAMEVILFTNTDLSVATNKLYGNKYRSKHSLWTIAAKCSNKRMLAAVQCVWSEGLDNKIQDEGCFETELMRKIRDGNRENVQSILNLPDTDLNYIMKRENHDGKTALEYAEDTYERDLMELLLDKILELLRNNDADKDIGNIYTHHSSLLAICVRYKHRECFESILKNLGLDNFEQFSRFKTALMEAVDNRNMEYIETITNAPGINGEYFKKTDDMGETALSQAIKRENSEIITVILQSLNRVCRNDIDGEKEKADILNDVDYGGTTALHRACFSNVSLEQFKMLYNEYPVGFRKDALERKTKAGKTALSICRRDDIKDIKEFIEQQMKELN